MLLTPRNVKTYTAKSSARAVVKKQGLNLLKYEVIKMSNGKYTPEFEVDLLEDAYELNRRGFRVTLNR